MLNRYLNRQGKLDLTMMGYMASCLISMRDRFNTGDWNKESKTAIKTAATWADKAFGLVCNQLAPEEGRALINNLKALTGAKMEIKPRTMTANNVEKSTLVSNDDMIDLAEEIVEQNCKVCRKRDGEQDECAIRCFFHRYDIEPLDLKATGCPYKYDEKVTA